MSSSTMLRVAARGASTTFFRANPLRQPLAARASVVAPVMVAGTSLASFSTTVRRAAHHEETFEEFTSR